MSHAQEWDNYAVIYEKKQRSGQDANVNHILPALLRKIPDNLENKRTLDLCCGRGILTLSLLERGASVYAIDGSQALLTQAKASVKASQKVVFDKQDVCQLNLNHPPFDLVVSNMALQDLYDAKSFIRAMAQVCHQQTQVLVSFRHPFSDGWQEDYLGEQTIKYRLQSQWQPLSISEFYPKRYHRSLTAYIGYFLEAGFRIEEFQEVVNPSSDPVRLIAVIIKARLSFNKANAADL